MKKISFKLLATTIIFALISSCTSAQKIGEIKNLVLKFIDYKCTDTQNWTNNHIILIFTDTKSNEKYYFTMYSDTSFDATSQYLWVNAKFGQTDCDDKTTSNIGENYNCKLKYELVDTPDKNDENKVLQVKKWLVIALKSAEEGEKRKFNF